MKLNKNLIESNEVDSDLLFSSVFICVHLWFQMAFLNVIYIFPMILMNSPWCL